MECFAEIVKGQRPLTFFVKHSNLDVWQGSEYTSAICYSLFGKIDDVLIRLIQLQCKFTHFKIQTWLLYTWFTLGKIIKIEA